MNLNFNFFVDKIASGEKQQAILPSSRDIKRLKIGDKITLYSRMYSTFPQKLGEAEIESIKDIAVFASTVPHVDEFLCAIKCNGDFLDAKEILKIGKEEGFSSIENFRTYLFINYNFKDCRLIRWKNFKRKIY